MNDLEFVPLAVAQDGVRVWWDLRQEAGDPTAMQEHFAEWGAYLQGHHARAGKPRGSATYRNLLRVGPEFVGMVSQTGDHVTVVIKEAHRRKGYGKAAVSWSFTADPPLTAEVQAGDANALAFCAACGFRVESHVLRLDPPADATKQSEPT
jgi:GNAT superfamily N-acetyltransferase